MQWLRVWVPCQDLAAFDIQAGQTLLELLGLRDSLPLITHSDVCEPAYTGDGRCPRTVVSAMSPSRMAIMCFVADQRAWQPALQEAELWCRVWACYFTPAFLSCKSHDTSMAVQEAVRQTE